LKKILSIFLAGLFTISLAGFISASFASVDSKVVGKKGIGTVAAAEDPKPTPTPKPY
jgi:hypothetical protein